MIDNRAIEKPVTRGRLRQILGREYFILRRRLDWLKGATAYCRDRSREKLPYDLISHKSFLMRPLKDVDMYLQRNKVTNLQIAISNIDGLIIRPGETFSVWRSVGRPTRSKGFLDGLVLSNGTISKGVGGGLCQLGNLLYWMALHSPLTIAERWRHGFDVFPDVNRKIPFACGATLSYNYIDLQIKNDTKDLFQINLWLDDEFLNGEIRSDTESSYDYEVFETDHLIKMQWWGGYSRHNKIWKRSVRRDDRTFDDRLITENHAVMMYNPLLTEGGE